LNHPYLFILSQDISELCQHAYTSQASTSLLIFCSPSDLEADDEDNQEFDSLNQSDSTVSSLVHVAEVPSRPRPGTPTGDNPDEVSTLLIYWFKFMRHMVAESE
jgi:hypothetical protein